MTPVATWERGCVIARYFRPVDPRKEQSHHPNWSFSPRNATSARSKASCSMRLWLTLRSLVLIKTEAVGAAKNRTSTHLSTSRQKLACPCHASDLRPTLQFFLTRGKECTQAEIGRLQKFTTTMPTCFARSARHQLFHRPALPDPPNQPLPAV